MAKASDVVATCTLHLGDRELRKRCLPTRASRPRDADRLVGKALGLIGLVVVEQRKREDSPRRRAGRFGGTGDAFGVLPAARRLGGIQRQLGELPRSREVTRIERLERLFEGRSCMPHAVSENVTLAAAWGQREAEPSSNTAMRWTAELPGRGDSLALPQTHFAHVNPESRVGVRATIGDCPSLTSGWHLQCVRAHRAGGASMKDEKHILERRIGVSIALALVSAILLAAACGGGDGERATVVDDDDDRPGPPPMTMADGGVHSDSQILQVLLTLNTGAVERGESAQLKATSDEVKDFAALMIADHSAANERLQTLAREKGIGTDSSDVNEKLKAESAKFAERIAAVSGPAFDRAYVETEIVAHVKGNAVIDRSLQPIVVDPDLERMLADLLRSGASQQEHAQQILRDLRAEGGSSSSETSADASTSTSTRDGGAQREAGSGTQ
jgi:putative membrane protein